MKPLETRRDVFALMLGLLTASVVLMFLAALSPWLAIVAVPALFVVNVVVWAHVFKALRDRARAARMLDAPGGWIVPAPPPVERDPEWFRTIEARRKEIVAAIERMMPLVDMIAQVEQRRMALGDSSWARSEANTLRRLNAELDAMKAMDPTAAAFLEASPSGILDIKGMFSREEAEKLFDRFAAEWGRKSSHRSMPMVIICDEMTISSRPHVPHEEVLRLDRRVRALTDCRYGHWDWHRLDVRDGRAVRCCEVCDPSTSWTENL